MTNSGTIVEGKEVMFQKLYLSKALSRAAGAQEVKEQTFTVIESVSINTTNAVTVLHF